MAKPKFELNCEIEQNTVYFFIKVVSPSFISDIRIQSFELIYFEGKPDSVLLFDNAFPTSINYTEGTVKIKYDHRLLKSRPIIAKELRLVFTFKDENDFSYYCEAIKEVNNMHDKMYAQGSWKTRVYKDPEECNVIPENVMTNNIDVENEIIAACVKVSNNPVSYAKLDEDGLNRIIRDLLKSSLEKFGYSIHDQTQQGYGQTGQKSGEIDIQIEKNGIPVVICEALIHRDEQRLHEHIEKAIGRYNQSGCKKVVIIEYSRSKEFGVYWEKATKMIDKFEEIELNVINSGLMGVKVMKGYFNWQNDKGDFLFIGVNCHKDESVK